MTDHLSRRAFARLLGAGAATISTSLPGLAAGSASAVPHGNGGGATPANAGELKFPNGFVWGSATASY